MIPRFFTHAILAAAMFSLSAAARAAESAAGGVDSAERFRIDSVIAVVNDEVITLTDLQRSLIPLIKQLRGNYTGEELRRKVAEAQRTVLNQLIENKLILQTAVHMRDNQELSIPEKEVLAYCQRIIDRFPSREVFEETLKRENLSFEDFKKDCVDQLLVKKLVSMKVSSRVFVSTQDIRNYYEEHAEDYTTPARITFSQIWLKKNGQDEEKVQTLKDLRGQIEKGADFKAMAVQHSEGPHAADGGLWKNVVKGQFTPELDRAIWELTPGQVSPVIETPVSFHLVKVEVIEKSRVVPIEEVWDEIQKKIYFERAEQLRKEWIEELRRDAYVQVFDVS
jgi:peptidyl-prolyl cis-trans isomerase SurA